MENQSESNTAEAILKEVICQLVRRMGFSDCEVAVKKTTEENKETFICDIRTKESNFLIGQYGMNLQSLQHIARVLARKKIAEAVSFVLDVNSYRQEKNESILKMAKNMAEQALLEKRAVVLRPMSPYERRIVHMELSKIEEVKTESIGEGEDRRIVIKPANLI
jgi:spoIIIJ-associated protein